MGEGVVPAPRLVAVPGWHPEKHVFRVFLSKEENAPKTVQKRGYPRKKRSKKFPPPAKNFGEAGLKPGIALAIIGIISIIASIGPVKFAGPAKILAGGGNLDKGLPP